MVCETTLSNVSVRYFSALYAGMITDIFKSFLIYILPFKQIIMESSLTIA